MSPREALLLVSTSALPRLTSAFGTLSPREAPQLLLEERGAG